MELLVQGGMPYYLGPFPNVNTDKEGFEYIYIFIYLFRVQALGLFINICLSWEKSAMCNLQFPS